MISVHIELNKIACFMKCGFCGFKPKIKFLCKNTNRMNFINNFGLKSFLTFTLNISLNNIDSSALITVLYLEIGMKYSFQTPNISTSK